jgi:hypothetical protein
MRQEKVVWTYDDPAGKDETSNDVMLSNGNVLFAHQHGVTEITRDKKVIWNYDAPAGHEVRTAIPIGRTRFIYPKWQPGGGACSRYCHQCHGKRKRCRPGVLLARMGSFVTLG